MSAQRQAFDVAISGCGPTGVTLAGLLGRAGLRVLVLDRSPHIHPQPRAVGFDQDAMRIFQRLGAAEAIAPHVAPFRHAVYLGQDGRTIQEVHPVAAPWPLAWRPNYACDQPGLESALRDHLATLPRVELRTGCELLEARDLGDRVRLSLRDAASGESREETARWLVGCDGASSPLRRALGLELKSLEYDVPWIVVDVLVDEPWLSRLPTSNVQYCQPRRPSTHVVCPGAHRRWEFMLVDGESPEDSVTEPRLWELLAPWLEPGQARIWRAAAYRFHALVARQWRSGRILLAGDSVHQTPPFMGQGMCQGIRDAGNLAWKLVQVVRGQAGQDLLDSYQAERAPHVEATTALARELGVLISERDPVRARARDAALLASGGGEPPRVVRQSMIPGLVAGLIEPASPRAGDVFPQPWVLDRSRQPRRLDELAADRFRLVLAGAADAATLDSLRQLAQAHGLPLQHVVASDAADTPDTATLREAEPVLLPWLAQAGCIGAVVRPDHYTFGAFTTVQQARELLDALARRVGAASLAAPAANQATPGRAEPHRFTPSPQAIRRQA